MDTKKLRELAETLDVLGTAQIKVFNHETEDPQPHVVVRIPASDLTIATNVRDLMISALCAAEKQVQEEIRKEVNKGQIVLRNKDSVLNPHTSFEDYLKPNRPVEDFLKRSPLFEEAMKGPKCR